MKRSNNVGLHVMVALALSLVINFSYLLAPIITERGIDERSTRNLDAEHSSGVLHLTRDMHGYIICDCDQKDSTYVSGWQVRTMKLSDGDVLEFTREEGWGNPSGERIDEMPHPRLDDIITLNGEEFDFDTLYDRPSRTVEFVWQIAYYGLVSFLMLLILTWIPRSGNVSNWVFMRRVLIVVLLSIIFLYFAPVMSHHNGVMRIVFFFQSGGKHNAYLIVITKCIFMLMVNILYARIFLLLRQRQVMEVENERLKTENLSTRYNMLMGQINPHFFFNSLNSLSMLVREKDNERALKYIEQLSYTFRYIIQNGQASTTTLKEELDFARSYAYLFKIRYADKLFFEFDVDEMYNNWRLPALSLQPLIGNTVKHNSLTTKRPLTVYVRVVDGVLEIENAKYQKLDVEPSTGIGLDNLNSRWQIIAGKSIEVVDTDTRFIVRLPLENPKL